MELSPGWYNAIKQVNVHREHSHKSVASTLPYLLYPLLTHQQPSCPLTKSVNPLFDLPLDLLPCNSKLSNLLSIYSLSLLWTFASNVLSILVTAKKNLSVFISASCRSASCLFLKCYSLQTIHSLLIVQIWQILYMWSQLYVYTVHLFTLSRHL